MSILLRWWLHIHIWICSEAKKPTDCTCDCCAVTNRKTDDTAEHLQLHCAPVAFFAKETTEELKELLGPRCPLRCTDAKTGKSSFLSKNGVVEASRYCIEKCLPVLSEINSQCADASYVNEMKPHMIVPTALHSTKSESLETMNGINPNQALSNARRDALQAGAHAQQAKIAYETAKAYAKQMRVAWDNAIKYGESAKGTDGTRKWWEILKANEHIAHKNALKAAIGMAKMYKDAYLKVRDVALKWKLRLREFNDASASRASLAIEYRKNAEYYRSKQEFPLAKEFEADAVKMDAEELKYKQKAEEAHKISYELEESEKWYIWAQKTAVLNQIRVFIPAGVAQVALPPGLVD